jgi:cleavage stimulation factor subunit 3
VGDLTSISKVDRRRREAVNKEYGSMPTLLLIDRYKFMDLVPCTMEQLKILGYKVREEGVIVDLEMLILQLTPNIKPQLSGANQILDGPMVPLSNLNASSSSVPSTSAATASSTTSSMFTPDPKQMVPFKPRIMTFSEFVVYYSVLLIHISFRADIFNSCISGSYVPLSGGIFAPPPAVGHLMQQLPPPNCFTGPHVMIDALMETLRLYKMPDECEFCFFC